MKLTEMSCFHHVLHVVFHRLSFDWSSFNDVISLCPLLLWWFNGSDWRISSTSCLRTGTHIDTCRAESVWTDEFVEMRLIRLTCETLQKCLKSLVSLLPKNSFFNMALTDILILTVDQMIIVAELLVMNWDRVIIRLCSSAVSFQCL